MSQASQARCTCIHPKCERQAAGMGPADYCQMARAVEEVLAAGIAAGEVEVVGIDPQGRPLYRKKGRAWRARLLKIILRCLPYRDEERKA